MFDKITHGLGMAALTLLGSSVSGHLPGWLVIAAAAVAGFAQVSTGRVPLPPLPRRTPPGGLPPTDR